MYNYKFFSGWKEPDIKSHPKYSQITILPDPIDIIINTNTVGRKTGGFSRHISSLQANYRRKYGTPGKITLEQWTAIVRHYAPDNRCLCCGEFDYLIADHIVPASKGGSNWPINIQPLCEPCNIKKGNRHNKDYRPDLGDWTLHNFPSDQTFP